MCNKLLIFWQRVSTAQLEEVKQNMARELAEVNSSKDKFVSEVKEMKKKVNFYITKIIFHSTNFSEQLHILKADILFIGISIFLKPSLYLTMHILSF